MTDICLCGIAREDCDYHRPAPLFPQQLLHTVPSMFSVQHVLDACKLNNSSLLRIHFHSALFSRVRKNSLLDIKDGVYYLNDWYVNTGLEYSLPCKAGGTFDTLLTFDNGGEVFLRTKEHP